MPQPSGLKDDDGFRFTWDEPLPVRKEYIKRGERKWTARLAPMKDHPGRRARLYHELTKNGASSRRRYLMEKMRGADPYDIWLFESHRDPETGTYGIWATYKGRRTEREMQLHLEAARATKALFAQRKAAKALRTDKRPPSDIKRQGPPKTPLQRAAAAGAYSRFNSPASVTAFRRSGRILP